VNFSAPADELRRQEIARLKDALVPRLEALRSMTTEGFRTVIAEMLERFGHAIETDPNANFLVTTKAGQKFVTACATPADPTPTGTRDLARLHHDGVIAANAERGFFITARGFTDQAEKYAESAPLDLFDGARLVKALNQSKTSRTSPGRAATATWSRRRLPARCCYRQGPHPQAPAAAK
jgi:hypothetical protein